MLGRLWGWTGSRRSLASASRAGPIPLSACGHPGERAQAGPGRGDESPPPSAQRGAPETHPKALPPGARSLPSPTGPAPPRANTHNVVTAEPTRTETDGHTAALSRQTRAEHARTPKTQGPVWAVTPAINRSLDPRPSPRQNAPPPRVGPAPSSRPASTREFPAFLRPMLPFPRGLL